MIDLEMSASVHVGVVKVADKVDSILENAESQSRVQDEIVRIEKRVVIGKRSPRSLPIF